MGTWKPCGGGFGAGMYVRWVAVVGGCSQARLQSQGVVRVEVSEISCLQR